MIAPGEQLGGAPRLDSGNTFGVSVKSDKVIITQPRWNFAMFSPVIPVEQALNLAAWIVCLVDPGLERFNRLVKEIKKS